MLRLRAKVLALIRRFFEERNVIEVETPCLESVPASDHHIEPFTVVGRYLRTSPEFLMKRMMIDCSEDIYQIGKVFRGDETSRLHNPEFTMLEWYRHGWEYRQLMEETDGLLHRLLSLRHQPPPASHFVAYRELFTDMLQINPWTDSAGRIIARARAHGYTAVAELDDALDFLMVFVADTHFPEDRLTFVHGYPPQQSQLAKVTDRLAERFEVFWGSIELVNGYSELTEVEEYRCRFARDNELAVKLGKTPRSVDNAFANAIEQGLPECAGASLGIDRVLMVIADAADIRSTLSFDWNSA